MGGLNCRDFGHFILRHPPLSTSSSLQNPLFPHRPLEPVQARTPQTPQTPQPMPNMPNPVPAVLPTGAYVIRNRCSQTALHSKSPEAAHEGTSVKIYQRDENQYMDQQIWWIEPLAEYDDSYPARGVVYSITSPGSGKALYANPKSRTEHTQFVACYGG